MDHIEHNHFVESIPQNEHAFLTRICMNIKQRVSLFKSSTFTVIVHVFTFGCCFMNSGRRWTVASSST